MSGSESEMRAKRPRAPGSSACRLRLGPSSMVSSRVGIGSPWGSWVGCAELGRDQLLELIGEHVLEHLGLVVDAVPGHAEALDQVELEQAVVAHDLERDPPPAVGERDAAVGPVLDQPELAQPLDHARGRCRGDPEALGQRVGGHRLAAPLLQRVDRLGVVLDRRGAHERMSSATKV